MINNYNSSGWRAGTYPETQLEKVNGSPPNLFKKMKSTWLMSFFLMAFMLLGLNSVAQTITIGSSALASTGGTNGNPIYRSSAGSAFNFSQSAHLYRSTDLSTMLSGSSISSFGFWKSTAATLGAGRTANLKIYMKNTSNAALNNAVPMSTYITGATLVYSNTSFGPADLINGYNVLSCIAPFVYSGGSLEIYVDWAINTGTGNATTDGFTWNYDSSTAIQAAGTSSNIAITSNLATTQLRRYKLGLTFTPPAPCAGTPAPGNTVATNASPCYDGSTLLSMSVGGSGSGNTFQWFKNGTLIPAANSQTLAVSNVIAADSYYCEVTCTGSGFTGSSTPLVLSPLAPINTFPYTETFDTSSVTAGCWTISAGTGATQQWSYFTSDATNGVAGPAASTRFAGLNVFNAQTAFNTYNLFSPIVVLPTLAKQLRYSYFLGSGGNTVLPLSIFVSVNGAAFTSIYTHTSANSTFSSNNSVAGWKSNSIDLSAYAGQSVRFAYVATSNFGSGTCNMAVDEITFENVPTCFLPTALAVGSVTNSGATASWVAPTAGTPVNYEYEVRTSGAAGSGATGLVSTASVATLNAVITGLNPSTTYTVYVRTFCGAADNSSWTTGVNFTTTCNSVSVPYNEGFETVVSNGSLPACMSAFPAVTGTTTGKVRTYIASNVSSGDFNSALFARTGSKYSAIYWSPTTKGTVFSAPISLTAGVTYRATAWYNTDDTSWPTIGLYVGTSATEAGMTTTIQAISSPNATTDVYARLRGTFTPNVSGVYYFGMQADNTGTSAPNFCAFDDLEVIVSPPVIASFTPSSICAGAGTTVVITGTFFTGATSVTLNGTEASSFTVNGAGTQVSAIFPITATAGPLVVTNPDGSGTSATNVTVNQLPVVNPITGPSNEMCTSSSMTLANTTVGGIWSTSNASLATNVGAAITAVAAGNVVVSYAVTIDGCTTTVTYPITISEKVVVTTQPTSQTVLTGSPVSFSVVATGTGLSYQWEVDDNVNGYLPVSGETSATFNIASAPSTTNGYKIRCVVSGTSPCGPVTSNFATLTVGNTGIATQPANQTICDSGSVTFNVVASGDVVSYQWYQFDTLGDVALVDSATVSGATSASLTLSGLTTTNNGESYYVIITGNANAATTNTALLTVNTNATVAVSSLNNNACYTGGTVVFDATATGSFSAYQWEYSTDDFATAGAPVTNGTPVGVTYTNATTANLSVTTTAATPSAGAKYYRCTVVASAPCTNVSSTSAQLLINEPVISSQPANATVLAGGTATFSATAAGATYQWMRSTTASGTYTNVVNGTPVGVTYTGNTSNSLSVITDGSTAASTANFYKVKVTVPTACDKHSDSAQLTINNYCQPATTFGGAGDIVTNVVITNTADATNVTQASGGAAPWYTLYNNTPLNVGQLQNLSVATSFGTDGSQHSAIWVDYNQNGTFEASENVALSTSAASGSTTVTYNFTIPLSANTGITRIRVRGASDSAYTAAGACASATYGETEDYFLNITAAPTCSGTPPVAVASASSASICISGTTSLSATNVSTGLLGITYQWYNSTGLIAGANGTTFTTPVLTAPESFYLRVTCTNSGLFSDSNTISIGIDNPTVVSSTPGSRCGTGTVVLSATGSTGTSLDWFSAATGGTSLATGASFTTPSIAATTTFYVQSSVSGSTFNIGAASDVAANLSSLNGFGMFFSTTVASVIATADIYPSTVGTLNVTLRNTAGTAVDTRSFPIVAGDISTTVKKTLALNFNIPASSTGWSINYDLAINRGAGSYSYPYTNSGFSITGNTLDGNNITGGTRYYFYNWNITRGCNSPTRTAVVATVSTPPALAISSSASTVCAGNTTPVVTVTTGTADYDTYTWSPTTGVSGNATSGFTFTPTATTTYTLTATQSAGLCANAVTHVVTVNPLPAVINLTASSTVCSTAAPVLLAVAPVNPTPSSSACVQISNGQYPSSAYSATACDGTTVNSIVSDGFAGEYSVVNVSANTNYRFTSSGSGDFVTIFNGAGTIVLAYGASPLSWFNASEPFVRFLSVNTGCTSDLIDRTRSFTCRAADSVVFTPSTGLFTNVAGTTPYTGTAVTQVYAKPTATTTYTATSTSAAGCPRTATTTLTITPATTWYADADGDTYGNLAVTQMSCAQPTGFVANSTDCDDANANVNPGKAEIAYNGIDDNCDGNFDEGFPPMITSLTGPTCGSTLANNFVAVHATQVPGASGYRFRVTNMTSNSVQIIDRVPFFWFQFNTVADLTFGTQYKIEVMVQRAGIFLGNYGPACFVNTPSTGGTTTTSSSLNPASCGITLASINTTVSANPLSTVTGYRFRVTNTMDSSVQVLDRTVAWFRMNMLPTWNYGATYTVEVALKTTGTAYAPYGSICSVTTPAVPAIQAAFCGTQMAKGYLDFGTVASSGVTSYKFEVTNTLTSAVQTLIKSVHYLRFNELSGIAPATPYSFRVSLMTAGTFSAYGPACTITSPAASRESFVAEGSQETFTEDFKVLALPNPFSYNFAIDMTSNANDKVGIKIYDMIGKLIEAREVEFMDINNVSIGENYPSGVYNVIVNQGENVKTLRVIKR